MKSMKSIRKTTLARASRTGIHRPKHSRRPKVVRLFLVQGKMRSDDAEQNEASMDAPSWGRFGARLREVRKLSNGGRRSFGVWIAIASIASSTAGCARVRPYEREHLTDPIMSLEASTDAEVRELKWLEAREGSTGGTGGAGGGCACN